MRRAHRSRRECRHRAVTRYLIAVQLLVVMMGATACNNDARNAVTVFGPEIGPEARALEDAFVPFTEQTGIQVEVEGTRDFEVEIGARLDAGDPPDIAMFPQPGRLRELGQRVQPLPEAVASQVEQNFDDDFTGYVHADDEVMAVPVKTDLKSLVWYSPEVFARNGYEVPQTFEGFLQLTDRMRTDGNPPFCLGIESGEASGWPVTDWIEDFILRLEGPDLYDQWAAHQIPFDHPAVVAAAQTVIDLWSQEGFVFGGRDAAAVTGFADAGLPVLQSECMMHRQANFYAANWPADIELGPGGDIDAFHLPGSADNPNVTLSGGLYAAAFSDDEDVNTVMEFISSTDFANIRAANPIGGFLSPNQNVDVNAYPDALTRHLGEILGTADPVRFDGSDLMPGEVGTGSFWDAAVAITVGSKDVATAFADVEANWPAGE